MSNTVTVDHVRKSYRRYAPDRPGTIQEAVARGLQRMRHVDRFWALNDVSFDIRQGEILALAGLGAAPLAVSGALGFLLAMAVTFAVVVLLASMTSAHGKRGRSRRGGGCGTGSTACGGGGSGGDMGGSGDSGCGGGGCDGGGCGGGD